MSKYFWRIYLSLVMIPFICGCSVLEEALILHITPTPDTGGIGDLIEVTYVTGPDIEASQNLSFRIKNLSEYCMVFPYDFGIKLWIDLDGSWEEIKNKVHYSPEQDIIFDPVGELFSVWEINLFPDLSNIFLQQKMGFRALISARLCDDQSIVIDKEIQFTVSP